MVINWWAKRTWPKSRESCWSCSSDKPRRKRVSIWEAFLSKGTVTVLEMVVKVRDRKARAKETEQPDWRRPIAISELYILEDKPLKPKK